MSATTGGNESRGYLADLLTNTARSGLCGGGGAASGRRGDAHQLVRPASRWRLGCAVIGAVLTVAYVHTQDARRTPAAPNVL